MFVRDKEKFEIEKNKVHLVEKFKVPGKWSEIGGSRNRETPL